MTQSAIEIANPLPGGMKYTSKANYYISVGIAFMDGNKLRFTETNQERKLLRDISFWNGSDNPTKMHRPGEVRS
jgi:hypothetical protein